MELIRKKRNKLKPGKGKRKEKEVAKNPGQRSEHDLPSDQIQWINQQHALGEPENPTGIPPGLLDASASPERTLAWLRATCKFARGRRDADPDERAGLPPDEPEVRRPG